MTGNIFTNVISPDMPPPPPKRKGPPPPKKKLHGISIQSDLIAPEAAPESAYTSKIKAPIYKPTGKKPDIFELVDKSKSAKLTQRIESSGVTDAEKHFLIIASKRHNVFSYKKIADYYAHSGKEMQSLMEDSALVIIDFGDALQKGYVKYSEEIAAIYVKEHGKTS